MHWACANGSVELVKLLIANHAFVNAQDNDGVTPLMRAAFAGNSRIVHLLMASEADPHVYDRDGISALSGAQRLGYDDVADLLQCGSCQNAASI